MIDIKDLHKAFRRNPVLKGIDLSISPGSVTAVLGPNGSGKTTLLKCILGMVIPDRGRIQVFNEPICGHCGYRKEIGYLPQIARFPENLTAGELIRMVKDLRRQHADESKLVSTFRLEPFLKKRLRYLSGGTRQKINVVLAFLFDSRILILDEPTAGLDPLAVIQLKELIREHRSRDKTIIVTTHILPLVEEVAERVIFLMEGIVYFDGTVKELMERFEEETFERAIAAMLKQKSYA